MPANVRCSGRGLGVRYPLQLLPLLLFEFTWKAVGVLAIGLPLWRAGRLDAATGDTGTTCLFSLVLFALVIPWGHVLRYYGRAPGDRWRDGPVPQATAPGAGVVAPAP